MGSGGGEQRYVSQLIICERRRHVGRGRRVHDLNTKQWLLRLSLTSADRGVMERRETADNSSVHSTQQSWFGVLWRDVDGA